MDFLGDKANSGLGLINKGIRFELFRTAGNKFELLSIQWDGRINVTIPNGYKPNPVALRTMVIHEMGHFVDYNAGVPLGFEIGITTNNYRDQNEPKISESPYWVGEWEWIETGIWAYTGSDPEGIPSNYVYDKSTNQCKLRICPGEDFAETFTWMVYEYHHEPGSRSLNNLDIPYDYNVPSKNRRERTLCCHQKSETWNWGI